MAYMENNYLTTSQLAGLLGISRVAVFKKIKSGKIKTRKIGRSFVIDKSDLPEISGAVLKAGEKKEIDKAVLKTVQEYGLVLKLLGQE